MPTSVTNIPTVDKNDARIPKIGLGTWELRGEICSEIVRAALELGYTHIDTAQGYANEEAVGEGLAASGLPRRDVFITTKVQPRRLALGDLQRSVEESLKRLRVDQIDLLLLHWPNPQIPLADSILALNKVKRDGLVRHIGLSNFTLALLDEAWHLSTEPFAAAQLEYHPYLDQGKMLAALRRRDMAIIAYCPIALGKVVGDPVIEAIGAAHRRSAAQVTLRWLVQQPDIIAITRSSKPARLAENFAVFDFSLSSAEMAQMGALPKSDKHLINQPHWVPVWD